MVKLKQIVKKYKYALIFLLFLIVVCVCGDGIQTIIREYLRERGYLDYYAK